MLAIYQSIYLDNYKSEQLSLLDFFLFEIKQRLQNNKIFDEIEVIVPNLSMGDWLDKKITMNLGISSGINFITLHQFILQLYTKSNPTKTIFNTHYIRDKIYDYLLLSDIDNDDFKEIKDFICVGNNINLLNVYVLASQLKIIFEEYIILRTNDIINNNFLHQLPIYQQKIWQYIFNYDYVPYKNIDNIISFVDIYNTFMTDITSLIEYIPKNIIIYGLTSIYSSELDILQSLAIYTDIKWYQMVVSNKYYADLYSDATRIKLQAKILKEPYLTLDDLYLVDGNPLVANLGQKLREFNELILNRNIEIHQLDLLNNKHNNNTYKNSLLELIQQDIHNIVYRCDKKYTIYNNLDYYQDPVIIKNEDNSIKINVCHNKMREVQVLFNYICEILAIDQNIDTGDILVIAPDISIYHDYIKAIFDNEYTNSYGEKVFLPYNISGVHIPQKDFYQLIELLLNLEYHAPINLFFDLLNNTIIRENFLLSVDDIEQIKYWCSTNNISFGLSGEDYKIYDYTITPNSSILDLINRLVLGVTINSADIIKYNDTSYIPYQNIESNNIELINKIGMVYKMYLATRCLFYRDEVTYKNFSCNDFQNLLDTYLKPILVLEDSIASYNEFIHLFMQNYFEVVIDLKVLKSVIKEMYAQFSTKARNVGKILFTSMQLIKNIPYKMIYCLGINMDSLPTIIEPNKLSILNQEWMIADRNINLDDKQNFLSIILAAQKYLYFSYIGYENQSNQKISPSILLELLIRVIMRSALNANELIKNIICYHSIYPYIYSKEYPFYMSFWQNIKLANILPSQRSWDLNKQNSEHKINDITYKEFLRTFKFTNNNLSQRIGYNTYPEKLSDDFINLEFNAKHIIKQLVQLFEQNSNMTKEAHYQYANSLAIITANSFGDEIFNYTFDIYTQQQQYVKTKLSKKISLQQNLNILFQLVIDNSGICAIINDITRIYNNKFKLDKLEFKKDKINVSTKQKLQLESDYDLIIEAIISLVIINLYQNNFSNIIIDYSVVKIYNDNKIIEVRAKNSTDYHEVFSKILQFYNFSLTNLVLIDKAIIDSYYNKRDIELCQKKLIDKNSNDYMKNKNKQQDLILDNIYHDYFYKYNTLDNNSIIMLVEILDYFDYILI